MKKTETGYYQLAGKQEKKSGYHDCGRYAEFDEAYDEKFTERQKNNHASKEVKKDIIKTIKEHIKE